MGALLQTALPMAYEDVDADTFNRLVRVLELNLSAFDPDTTNQRMELRATLEALRALEGPLLIVSDSTYVVHCFRDSWWRGWQRRGWVNSQKKPVANQDLWKPLIDLYVARGNVDFEWVKGHSGDRWNDEADRLAVEAGQRQINLQG